MGNEKRKSMKKVIYKYELKKVGLQDIHMPMGAEILCVQTVHDIPFLWALVDPEQIEMSRSIEIYGTGHIMDAKIHRKYIGTFQQLNGAFIWHVFER